MSAILQNPRAFPLAVILVCVGALASALASQHWGGLQPCVLCIYQRYAYGVALGIGILAFAAAPWRAGQRLWAYLAGLAFLGGGAIAAFHTGVERKWWQGTAECHAPEFDPTMTAKLDLFDDWQRARLREVSDKVTRYVEELDSARERATVVQDELAGRLSDDLNRKMYVLTVIAGIFLPLGFVTGLLGINVGGIPGTEAPWGFALVCALLLLLGLSEYWLFRWLKWL